MEFDSKNENKGAYEFSTAMMIINEMNKVSFANRFVPLMFLSKDDTTPIST